MASITKAELTDKANTAYDDFVAGATRADLMAFLDYMKDPGTREETGAFAITSLNFRDRSNLLTSLDLVNNTLFSQGYSKTWEDCLVIEGSGPILEFDLNSFTFYNGTNLEFDPWPDHAPIRITFSSPAKEEEGEQDDAKESESEEEGDESASDEEVEPVETVEPAPDSEEEEEP